MPDLDTLSTFFSLFSQYRFCIPDYQRGYAWADDNKNPQGPKELRELLEDIATLTEDNEHFTGLLVINENHDPGLRVRARGMVKPVFDVVDGQQRLTTIVILMNEIRRAMLEVGTDDLCEIAQDIQENYLFEPGAGSLLVPKLVLDENNRVYFEHNILEMGEISLVGATMKSHDNLLNARNYFAGELRKQKTARGEGFAAWLEALYGKVNGQLKVMVYRLHSESDAGVVFESMNSRGKKPNSMDLVKNYLLFAASKLEKDAREHLSREINHTWTIIFKQLSAAGRADNEDSLLEYHWMTVYNYDRKRWSQKSEKSDHIKEKFKVLVTNPERHAELFKTAVHYVQTLQNAVVAYTDIYNPTHTGAFQIFDAQPEVKKDVIKFSEKLIRIGVLRTFTPLLMAIRLRLPEDARTYLDVLQLCEKYAFRVFRVAKKPVTNSDDVLFRLGNQFYNQKITLETLVESIQRDLYERCDNDVFAQEFAIQNPNKWYGNNGPRNGLKYMLYEFEENLHGGHKPTINWDTILNGNKTIEHILPQNPGADGKWFKRFTTGQMDQYKHVLGNLTLTEDNLKLGNKSFAEKKGKAGQLDYCYANSLLKVEHELTGQADWMPTAIKARQKRLAEWAEKRWFVPEPPPVPDDKFEALKQRAKVNGFEAEFIKIHELALRLKLLPKANINRMSYKSPRDNKWAVLSHVTYANGIWLQINFQYFPFYKGVPEASIREIFKSETTFWRTTEDISEFIACLEQLADEVDANQAA